jgi:hypothetical protein
MELDEQNERERKYASLLANIADQLMKTQVGLDELVLQFALGKADARDKFEEAKEQLRHRVSEFKINNLGAQINDASQKMMGLLEELELQLSLGKVESKDKFEVQRKKIEAVIDKVRKELRQTNELFDNDHFEHEIETFKLKLEIFRQRFEVKKFEVKDSFRGGVREAKKKIEKTAFKLKNKVNSERSVIDKLRERTRRELISICVKQLSAFNKQFWSNVMCKNDVGDAWR